MKLKLTAALVLLTATVWAEEPLTPSRTLHQFGLLTSWGSDAGFGAENWGLSYRRFDYFDGTRTEGFYYAVVSGGLLHVIDGNSLADLRVLNVGWRGNPFRLAGSRAFDMQLDVGLAPVVELRLKKSALALDGESVGMGGTFGVYFPIGKGSDLGFSWEPVVDLKLLRWGNHNYRDPTYCDFAVYWVFKSARVGRNVEWDQP
jgi:hypothetical protein